jgi:Ca2+-binding RTX toxin-like protein
MPRVMRGRVVGPVAVALAMGLTSAAQAAEIPGTDGNDRIRGTRGADVIDAKAGDDRVAGHRGADIIKAGDGLDRVWGNRGADQLFGGPGADRLWGVFGDDVSFGEDGDDLMGGGWGSDRQYGGPGNDTIFAGRGRDESWGEDGDDNLWALAHRDRHGRNDMLGDTLHGGAGNDTFRTRDGERDTIDCGPGIDTALIDFKDVLANPAECEVVNRARHRKGEDRPETVDPPEDVPASE